MMHTFLRTPGTRRRIRRIVQPACPIPSPSRDENKKTGGIRKLEVKEEKKKMLIKSRDGDIKLVPQ